MPTMYPEVILYTLPYCPDCREAREFFRTRGVPFRNVDVSSDPRAIDDMMRRNGGLRTTPTICIGREVLINPDRAALAAAWTRLAAGAARTG